MILYLPILSVADKMADSELGQQFVPVTERLQQTGGELNGPLMLPKWRIYRTHPAPGGATTHLVCGINKVKNKWCILMCFTFMKCDSAITSFRCKIDTNGAIKVTSYLKLS